MSDSNIPFTSALNCSAISSEGDSDQGTSLSRNNDAISLYHLLNIHTSATTCRCDELRLCVLVLDCVCACPLHDDHEDCGSPGQLRSALGLSCRRDDGTKRSRSRPCFLGLWWVVVVSLVEYDAHPCCHERYLASSARIVASAQKWSVPIDPCHSRPPLSSFCARNASLASHSRGT